MIASNEAGHLNFGLGAMKTCWVFWLDRYSSWHPDSWGVAQTHRLVLAVPQAGLFCHFVAKAHPSMVIFVSFADSHDALITRHAGNPIE